MSSYKKLSNNVLLFALGNFGSKIISIIMVPLYTYHLTTTEYGTIDIIITTLSMLLPIVTLDIHDAVLRHTLDKKKNKIGVFTSAIYLLFVNSCIVLTISIIIFRINTISIYQNYIVILLVLQMLNVTLNQFTRALGKIKIYAINGILNTLVIGISNVVFIVFLSKGVNGYFQSLILGHLISIAFLSFSIPFFSYFKINRADRNLLKDMLVYSIPLIPNAFLWWILSASDRYVVLFFVGASGNGLLAVANKLPAILVVLNSIFFQAWQLSAIEEYSSDDQSNFYSSIFNYFSEMMFLATMSILVVLKAIMGSVVSNQYYLAWEITPFLLLGVVFSSFSSFFGTNYLVTSKTHGLFFTSLIASLVNLLLNFFLIPRIGVVGAGVSTFVSYFIIWILRIKGTSSYLKIDINLMKIVKSISILLIEIIVLFLEIDIVVESIIGIILLILIFLVNKDFIKLIFSSIKKLKR